MSTLTIPQLEQRVCALPACQGRDTTLAKRMVVYLMVAKFGPKPEVVHRATLYENQFIADAIYRLQQNNQLLTGVLDRAYLKPYFKDDLSILDDVLGPAQHAAPKVEQQSARPVERVTPAAPVPEINTRGQRPASRSSLVRDAVTALLAAGEAFDKNTVAKWIEANKGVSGIIGSIGTELRTLKTAGVIDCVAEGGAFVAARYAKPGEEPVVPPKPSRGTRRGLPAKKSPGRAEVPAPVEVASPEPSLEMYTPVDLKPIELRPLTVEMLDSVAAENQLQTSLERRIEELRDDLRMIQDDLKVLLRAKELLFAGTDGTRRKVNHEHCNAIT